MLYHLGKAFWALFNPGTLLLVLLLAGFAALLLRFRRIGLALTGLAAAMAAAFALTPADRWLVAPLEQRFAQPDPMPERVTGLVVLGGGIDVATAWRRPDSALNSAGDRLIAAAHLARRYPEATLLYASGAGYPHQDSVEETAHAARLLDRLGIAPGRLVLEDRSHNTHQNAVEAQRLAQPKPGETWLLITSAFHMPRAVAAFRAAGFPVVPYPVDHLLPLPGMPDPGAWFDGDLIDGLTKADIALKEYVGLLAYRLFGHTEELFPAPKASSGSGGAGAGCGDSRRSRTSFQRSLQQESRALCAFFAVRRSLFSPS
jgi:uncharacterized SAM-binding protein YcdF (DUF218 family)